MDIKVFRMNRLGIPQDRIAERLGLARKSFHYHLSKMAALPNSTNADLSRGFTVAQVAEKHGWTEPMVWSLALEDKDDRDRFKESWAIIAEEFKALLLMQVDKSKLNIPEYK